LTGREKTDRSAVTLSIDGFAVLLLSDSFSVTLHQATHRSPGESSMSMKSIPLSSYQIRLLAVLALINFVNFAARQVFVPLIPLLRDRLHVTDAELGSLQTFLLVVLAVGSIPFGFCADRFSRKAIIAIGILFWSVATFAGGLASTFLFFLVARAVVGLGEAAYAPAAQSMISGAFPQERRAVAQAIFASGMLLGGASGQALGGIIGPRYGWQEALFIVAFAGIVPGVALFWIDEPPRGPRSDVVPISKLLRVPAFVAMIFAGICITFSSVSLLTWGIDFAVNYKDFSLREASVSLAVIGLLSALFGVLTGGLVADRLHRSFPYGRIIAIAAAFLLAAPFLLLAIQSEEKSTVLVGLFVAGFFMSWYHGPVTAVLHDMMPRRAHATSVGVYMFATQLVGGLGPHVVGKISDLRDLQLGLQIAVAVMVCGALLMLLVIHFIRRDGIRHRTLDAFHAEPGN
jgi:MFS transporter, Spinster family, sphingosine-1-phosphate transporter